MIIISIILNGLVLSLICVGCDSVVTPIIVRCQSKITRADVAKLLCLVVPVGAFLARGLAGLIDISSLAIVGPTYVCLTGTTTSPISLKDLLHKICENGKQAATRLFGTK